VAGKTANDSRFASRILVVRLGAMGDIIHALPAVASLKHSFPGSYLTWVIEPKWAPLLEGNPFVDRVALLRRGSFRGLYESWRDLRAAHCDLAIDFQGLIKSALVATAPSPDRIYGFHHSQVRERTAALFYSNKTVSHSNHVVDRNIDLATAAGAVNPLRTFPLPSGAPEGPARRRFRSRLAAGGLACQTVAVGSLPGGGVEPSPRCRDSIGA